MNAPKNPTTLTTTIALLAFVLIAYLIGSAHDTIAASDSAAERAQAEKVIEAYRVGVEDGAQGERFRQSMQASQVSEARHE